MMELYFHAYYFQLIHLKSVTSNLKFQLECALQADLFCAVLQCTYHLQWPLQQLGILNELDINPFTVLHNDLELNEAIPSFLIIDEDTEEDINIEV